MLLSKSAAFDILIYLDLDLDWKLYAFIDLKFFLMATFMHSLCELIIIKCVHYVVLCTMGCLALGLVELG